MIVSYTITVDATCVTPTLADGGHYGCISIEARNLLMPHGMTA